MNFLQLCQEAARDSGTVAGLPTLTTVVGATGRGAQLTGWVRDAWIDIQNERSDWLWMRKTFSKALTIDQIEYTAAQMDVTDFGAWLPDLPAEGWRNLSIYESGAQENEGELMQIAYPLFRQRYQRGTHTHNQPTEWAITPQNKLAFGTKPDKAYIVRGEYRRSAQVLALDVDTPEMPVDYHRLIIAEALRLMSRSDEAYQVLIEKSQQYDRLRQPLVNSQTPQITLGGGPLA